MRTEKNLPISMPGCTIISWEVISRRIDVYLLPLCVPVFPLQAGGTQPWRHICRTEDGNSPQAVPGFVGGQARAENAKVYRSQGEEQKCRFEGISGSFWKMELKYSFIWCKILGKLYIQGGLQKVYGKYQL